MNGQELIRLIDGIARERNVDKEALYTDIEQAMVSAARKHFNVLDPDEFTCQLDRLNGALHIFRGEEEIPIESLGRIPAQTAKQVMIQRFREDERSSIFDEFRDRIGALESGMAQRYEGGALVVSISRGGGSQAEGFMPRSEQIPGEQHQPGERVRCMILDVRDTGSQVKIVLTRAHEDFIRRLFEVEVPEVAERIIEIKAMAREPGFRTKLAVSSIDSKVDAVGACVGVRGSRIKNIVDELGGEKIDIVRWNESSQILIQNSLKPAEVVEISLCFELGRATVVVAEDQLSLAIGKRGQNVRLAARLTNWDIDILTPTEFSKSLDRMAETLKKLDIVDEEMIDRLGALGVISLFDVEEVGLDYLIETFELAEDDAMIIMNTASAEAQIVAEEQAREKVEAEKRRAEEAASMATSPGESQAADILGLGGGSPSADAEPAKEEFKDDGSGDIIDMLEARKEAVEASGEDAPEAAADASDEAVAAVSDEAIAEASDDTGTEAGDEVSPAEETEAVATNESDAGEVSAEASADDEEQQPKEAESSSTS